MSKRPQIKQSDGSLLDLPLDAETLQGKTLEEIALKTDIPTKTSQLTNDSGFLTEHQDISGKADKTELKKYLPLSGGIITGNIKAQEFTLPNGTLISSYSGQNGKDIRILAIGPDDDTIKSGTIHMGTTLPRLGENSWSSTFTFDMANATLYSSSEKSLSLGLSDKQWYKVYSKQIYQDGKQVATKEEIPTKTSQLTNNSGFITNAVNNLTNYYLKSETYTKSEVQQLLSTISSLKLEVVTNLPTTNISSNTIYLKPLDSTKENNIYEEYIYINSKWETIGTTAVDLTNYALKEDIPTKISELEQDVELGVSEEDVMDIIENNAESTTTLDV